MNTAFYGLLFSLLVSFLIVAARHDTRLNEAVTSLNQGIFYDIPNIHFYESLRNVVHMQERWATGRDIQYNRSRLNIDYNTVSNGFVAEM